jgi:hypothetical protein
MPYIVGPLDTVCPRGVLLGSISCVGTDLLEDADMVLVRVKKNNPESQESSIERNTR